MRKLFIAFSLLSVLATPAFAGNNLSVSGISLSKTAEANATMDVSGIRYGRDLTRAMNAGTRINAGGMTANGQNAAGGFGGSADLDRDVGGRANGGTAGGAKGIR